MIHSLQAGKKALVGMVVLALCAISFAPTASAATYYYPSHQSYTVASRSSQDVSALLNQLYALIAQLQLLQGGYGSNYTYNFPSPHSSVKTHISTSNKSYDVEVDTTDVDSDEDDESAVFEGEVELDDAPYAYVWFEYGTDGNLTEESDSDKRTNDGSFDIEVDDLDDNDRYYVRAVAEDPSGYRVYGDILAFTVGNNDEDDDTNNDDDTPEANTEDADDVDEDSAELRGTIEMNDFNNGLAFFVYGEDEDAVEEVEDEDMYSDIDEDGDDLQKLQLTSNLNGTRTFWSTVSGLTDDTDHFFRICVEYEDEDDDETLQCGDVEDFTTDED